MPAPFSRNTKVDLRIFLQLFNYYFSKDKTFTRKLTRMLGFVPCNLYNYVAAFRHRSVFPDVTQNNERLELLGDSVFDLIIAEYLFERYPAKDEGFITKMRSKVVNRKFLNKIGRGLGIEELIEYNKMSINIKDEYHSLSGNTLEALIAAVYLDIGYSKTRKFIQRRIILPFIDLEHLESVDNDFKSKLIEWSQKNNQKVEFRLLEEKSERNRTKFSVGVFVNESLTGQSEGFSKKRAEQQAAQKAVLKLNI